MIIRNHYSEEFRHSVLMAYFTGSESLSSISTRFGISKSVVGNWTTRYKSQYTKLLSAGVKSSIFVDEPQKGKVMAKESFTIAELEARIQLLERQLQEERMRSICMDKMIDIAERDLNIVIRKKSGAKQSKK